jgi:hypothetical protein
MNETTKNELLALLAELAAPNIRRADVHPGKTEPRMRHVASEADIGTQLAEPPLAPSAMVPLRAKGAWGAPPRTATSDNRAAPPLPVGERMQSPTRSSNPLIASNSEGQAPTPAGQARTSSVRRDSSATHQAHKTARQSADSLAEVVHISRADGRFDGPVTYKSSPAIPLPKRLTHEALLDAPWGSTLRWIGNVQEPASENARAVPTAEASVETLQDMPWGTLLSALSGESDTPRMDVSGVILVNGHAAAAATAVVEDVLPDASSWE